MKVRYRVNRVMLIAALLAAFSARGSDLSGALVPLVGDLCPDGQVNVLDVQRAVNQALGDHASSAPGADIDGDGLVTGADVEELVSAAFAAGGVIQLVRGDLTIPDDRLRHSLRVEALSLDGLRAEAEVDKSGRFELALWAGRGWSISVLDRVTGSSLGALRFSSSNQTFLTLPLPSRVSGTAVSLGRIAMLAGQPTVISLGLTGLSTALIPPHLDETLDEHGLPRYAGLILGPLFDFVAAQSAEEVPTFDARVLAEGIGTCMRNGAGEFARPTLADANGDGRPDCFEQVLECARATVEATQSQGAQTQADVTADISTVVPDVGGTPETEDQIASETPPVAVALARCEATLGDTVAGLTHPALVDHNHNGIPDCLDAGLLYEKQPIPALADTVADHDEDGILNMNDPAWISERGLGSDYPWSLDSDGNGIPDPADWDDDGDGLPDFLEDSDGNGVLNILDAPTSSAWDADGDGVPNVLDLDNNNDGRPDYSDAVEAEKSLEASSGLIRPVLGLDRPATSSVTDVALLEIGAPERLGDVWFVPILLPEAMADLIASLQFSFSLKSGAGLFLGIQPGAAALEAGKQVHFLPGSQGTRVLVTGQNQTLLRDGVVATVLLAPVNQEPIKDSLQLYGMLASSLQGTPVTPKPIKSRDPETPAPQEKPDETNPPADGGTGAGTPATDKPATEKPTASTDTPKETRSELPLAAVRPEDEWAESPQETVPDRPAVRNGTGLAGTISFGNSQGTHFTGKSTHAVSPRVISPPESPSRPAAEPSQIQKQRDMIQVREGLMRTASDTPEATHKKSEVAAEAQKGDKDKSSGALRSHTRRIAVRLGKDSEALVGADSPSSIDTPIQLARLDTVHGTWEQSASGTVAIAQSTGALTSPSTMTPTPPPASTPPLTGYLVLVVGSLVLMGLRHLILRASTRGMATPTTDVR